MPIRANISTQLIYRRLSSHTRLDDSKCSEYHFAGCSEVKMSIIVNIYYGINDPACLGDSCLAVQVWPCTLPGYWFRLVLSQARTRRVRTSHPQVTPALFTDCAKITIFSRTVTTNLSLHTLSSSSCTQPTSKSPQYNTHHRQYVETCWFTTATSYCCLRPAQQQRISPPPSPAETELRQPEQS